MYEEISSSWNNYWIVYNGSKEKMSGNIEESLLSRNESGKQYHGSLKN